MTNPCLSKRGFGASQVFAIAVVVVAGAIFIFSSSFMMNDQEAKNEYSVESLNDFYPHYVLMGLLRSPISAGYVGVDVPNPTVADAIILTRVSENGDLFEQDVMRVLESLLAPRACRGQEHSGYSFVIKDEGYFSLDYDVDAKNYELCAEKRSASVLLPTRSGSQLVTLGVCAKRSYGDSSCQ